MAGKRPMARNGAGGAIDATSVRILYRRCSGGYGWAWRRVPGRRAAAAVSLDQGPSPIVKISPSISLTTLSLTASPHAIRKKSPSNCLFTLSERSEAQLREGDRAWGGSVERNREPMDKNRIGGVAAQGERAMNREALVVKAQAAQIRRLCGEGSRSYLGRSHPAAERPTWRHGVRSQQRPK